MLNSFWTLWYHALDEKKWDLSSYQKLAIIKSREEFWSVFNNLNMKTGMLFLMRKNIPPLWESSENINGGAWSFMVSSNKPIENIFYHLASGILGESIIDKPTHMNQINGLSITPKSDSFILKIWTSISHSENITFNSSYFINNINQNMIFKHHKKNLGLSKKH